MTAAPETPVKSSQYYSHLTAAEVQKDLHTNVQTGLSENEADSRLTVYGRNELPQLPPVPWWRLFLDQFDDSLVKILLGAACVGLLMALLEQNMRELTEPFVIFAILILNASVGVWQEGQADEAIEALKRFAPKVAVVRRDGKTQNVAAELIVPGDVIEVHSGSRVPADCRVLTIHSTILSSDRSILNGESTEAINQVEAEPAHSGERFPTSMLYSGTAVVHGSALAVVVTTGPNTEIGAIERDVREQEETKTPLQVKLDEFGELLTKVIGAICLLLFVLHLYRHFFLPSTTPHHRGAGVATFFEKFVHPVMESLKVSVALAVAAIPEGLPAVVTTCLALGTYRMAAHNALVRELPAVESLGRCTVICSDKTGTLTTNMMSVCKLFTVKKQSAKQQPSSALSLFNFRESKFNVGSHAVTREEDGSLVDRDVAATDACLASVISVGSMCSEARLSVNADTKQVERTGEATEAAIRVMCEKLRTSNPADPETVRKEEANIWHKNATLEFSRDRKIMSTHCTHGITKAHRLFVKGAPEAILQRCTDVLLADGSRTALTADLRATIEREVTRLSGDPHALRCIAFAVRFNIDAAEKLNLRDSKSFAAAESNLTFVGTCGMLDPPREEVPDAISKCHSAGIRVIVITGDNKVTAEAICRKIGVFRQDEIIEGKSFTGDEFSRLTDAEQREVVLHARLFSRTAPAHKLRIVELLQSHQLICAMTGDGVNDAPALRKADIGLAMGSGTEVAKAASKMILADDNFSSIVKAVREGRGIYNNTQQFIRYLISSNIGEVVCIFLTGVLGLPDALLPVQLLWVNLVTDGLPAMALGFNPADPDVMEKPPRPTSEAIVNGFMFMRYLIVGFYVGAATVGSFLTWFFMHNYTFDNVVSRSIDGVSCVNHPEGHPGCAALLDPVHARGVALSVLVVVEMFNALNALSENQSLVTVRPTRNRYLLVAISISMALHFVILYVPWLSSLFAVQGLDLELQPRALPVAANMIWPFRGIEWPIVMAFSIPVIFVDEFLKFIARARGK